MRKRARTAHPHKDQQKSADGAPELDDDQRYFIEHPEWQHRLRAASRNELATFAAHGDLAPDGACPFVVTSVIAPGIWTRGLVGLSCQLAELVPNLPDELLALLAAKIAARAPDPRWAVISSLTSRGGCDD